MAYRSWTPLDAISTTSRTALRNAAGTATVHSGRVTRDNANPRASATISQATRTATGWDQRWIRLGAIPLVTGGGFDPRGSGSPAAGAHPRLGPPDPRTEPPSRAARRCNPRRPRAARE